MISKIFWLLFSFKGATSRIEFILPLLGWVIPASLLREFTPEGEQLFTLLFIAASIMLLWIILAILLKRMRAVGTGIASLLIFIPGLNILLIIYMCIKEGDIYQDTES